MYSIPAYGSMIADQVRMQAYAQALRQAVRPGCVVVDVGTGTGIIALLACQFGACRVYAIEPDDSIQVARETAIANGYGEKIEFIQDVSTRVKLPEQCDVMVSDLRGVLPPFEHHILAVVDARRRFLAPAGVLIPQRDTLWAAVVEAPEAYGRRVGPWGINGYSFDLRPAQRMASNSWGRERLKPEQLLGEPSCWATLEYATVESPDIDGEFRCTTIRAGTAHGLLIWFDATLADGVGFSNSPYTPETIYGGAFFPWSEPVELAPGDTVTVALKADLVGEDYVWRWDTHVLDGAQPGQVKASFKQSTFFGAAVSATRLLRRASTYLPMLSEDGQIDQSILALTDGVSSLEEIARRVAARFPARFRRWEDALTRVAELSEKYSR